MAEHIHEEIAQGSWFGMSLYEQMGNVGSEVGRAANWRKKGNAVQQDKALERAFDLLDLTMADPRWKKELRLKEICRAREALAEVFCGDNQYHDSPEALERYFYQFALAARLKK